MTTTPVSEPPAHHIEVIGLTGLPEVHPGDDLAALILATGARLMTGDVVVITSKVVSKAENRLVDDDRDVAIASETVRLVASRGPTRIVQTRHGLVCAAAGVDASNVPAGRVALLPVDPDTSARRIRDALRAGGAPPIAVVVTDTFGRPWRQGLVDVAIGVAGMAPLRDYRGRRDEHGNELVVTEMADADAVAAAAELVKGKLAGVPVAIVRGLAYRSSDAGAAALVRPAEQDMFRLGPSEAVAAALTASAPTVELAPGPVDLAAVRRALTAAENIELPGGWRLHVILEPADSTGSARHPRLSLWLLPPDGASPTATGVDRNGDSPPVVRAALAERLLLVALAGEGLAGQRLTATPGASSAAFAAGAPEGALVVGSLAVGPTSE